jgi:cytochrome P450
MSNTTSNHPSGQDTESIPSLGYSDIESLKLPALLHLHLSLFLGVFRPINALNPVHSEFKTADQIRSSLPGLPPMVMLNTARAVKALLSAPPYSFGTASNVGAPLLGAQTLFAIDGAEHQQHRKLIMPHFHGNSIRAYGSIMAEITHQAMAKWQLGKAFPIHAAFQEITLQVMLRILLGFSGKGRYEQLQSLFRDTLNAPLLAACLFFKPLQIDLGAWSPWGRLVRLKLQLSQLLLAEIADRRHQEPHDDVLGLLLAARDGQGQALDDQEIRDELMALMFAANEATAAALVWAIYWVHCDARVRDRVLAELTDLGPDPDSMDIAKLPYLSAVCNETLRISPVTLFAIPRAPKQLFNLLGYKIGPGVLLSPCTYLVHRDPKVYRDPQVFRPERFLDHQYSPYEFMPFGGSNRRCVGYALAMLEMKVVLAEMLRKMDFSLVSKSPALPQRHGTTFIPSGGLRVTAKLRPLA